MGPFTIIDYLQSLCDDARVGDVPERAPIEYSDDDDQYDFERDQDDKKEAKQ